MAGVVPPLRWWGWGERETDIPPGLGRLLHTELGLDTTARSRPSQRPQLPQARLAGDPLLERLAEICGSDRALTSDDARLRHAAGRSYLDLLRLRGGVLDEAPDAVLLPRDEAAVAGVLRACAAADCAVVPVGGGTSVVGGIRPLRGNHRAVVALSLRRLDGPLAIDSVDETATLPAGASGPEAEALLNAVGLTLGHFPQSWEYATLGGFAATRSAGQASSGYGRFDEMVLGLRCVTPRGEIVVTAHPATAAGPSMKGLVLGSEGRLGVITEVTVRVRRASAVQRYEAWSFTGFSAGLAAMRAMAQGGVAPDVARLSDAEESRVGMAMAEHGGLVEQLGRRYLRLRGHEGGCLLIAGWDSDALVAGARQAEARSLVRRHGGVPLGSSPGMSWLRQRYSGPYLRDTLMDAGVLVETLETATSWRNVESLHAAVVAALRDALGGDHPPVVGCHVSHTYPSGASLYFTVLAPAGEDAATRWAVAKDAATCALVDNGGTLTHHHAVGVDHRPYLEREIGSDAVRTLRAAARALDPTGIMNPGKLFPD